MSDYTEMMLFITGWVIVMVLQLRSITEQFKETNAHLEYLRKAGINLRGPL